jgi:hypothetical protein
MKRFFASWSISALSIVALTGADSVLAEETLIEATRDNTLYENAEGALSNGSGDYLFVGRTNSNGVRRAVIAFDDLSSIPAGSTIDSVRLNLQLSRETSSPTDLTVWRLVSNWGEGASNASGAEGAGAAATEGDATWVHTFYDNQTWLSPGGDYMVQASAQLEVDAVGNYTIESTQALVNDVQEWLDDPETNFGWILTAVEVGGTTAKRFNSRENPAANGPVLEVTFTPPPNDGSGNNWSGLWFDSSLDGEGYLLYDTPVGWIVYFFGYTPDEEQLWLISAEPIDVGEVIPGQIITTQMKVGTPGTFNNPSPSTELADWGSLQMNFDDCNKGIFVLESLNLSLLKISNVGKLVGVDGTACVDP